MQNQVELPEHASVIIIVYVKNMRAAGLELKSPSTESYHAAGATIQPVRGASLRLVKAVGAVSFPASDLPSLGAAKRSYPCVT
jgi:hypothetical protein